MNFARNLMAGASICAACAAPALVRAAPHIHLVGSDNFARLKPGSYHMKTQRAAGDVQHLTYTITFSASLPKLNVKTLLWTETWRSDNCIPPAHEKLKIPKKTQYAKLSVGTSTGPTSTCPNSNFVMFGPIYDLKKETNSDSFEGSLEVYHYFGYHLVLNVNTELF